MRLISWHWHIEAQGRFLACSCNSFSLGRVESHWAYFPWFHWLDPGDGIGAELRRLHSHGMVAWMVLIIQIRLFITFILLVCVLTEVPCWWAKLRAIWHSVDCTCQSCDHTYSDYSAFKDVTTVFPLCSHCLILLGFLKASSWWFRCSRNTNSTFMHWNLRGGKRRGLLPALYLSSHGPETTASWLRRDGGWGLSVAVTDVSLQCNWKRLGTGGNHSCDLSICSDIRLYFLSKVHQVVRITALQSTALYNFC